MFTFEEKAHRFGFGFPEEIPKKYLCRCEFQPKRSCLKHPDYQKLPWTTKIWRDEDVVDAVKGVDFQLVYR